MYYFAFVRVTPFCYFLLLFFQWCLQYSAASSANFINILFNDLKGGTLKYYVEPDIKPPFLQHPTSHLPLTPVPWYSAWPFSYSFWSLHTVFAWCVIILKYCWIIGTYLLTQGLPLVFLWMLHCACKDWMRFLCIFTMIAVLPQFRDALSYRDMAIGNFIVTNLLDNKRKSTNYSSMYYCTKLETQLSP